MHMAVLNPKSLDMINNLVQAGSDVHYCLKNGMTCVDFAKKYATPEVNAVLYTHPKKRGLGKCFKLSVKKTNDLTQREPHQKSCNPTPRLLLVSDYLRADF